MEKRKKDILGFTLVELEDLLEAYGYERYRARQLFHWIYRRGVPFQGRATNLPARLKDFLDDSFSLGTVTQVSRRDSAHDGTSKFGFRLYDGSLVESVRIPSNTGVTYCLSAQAGCAFGCSFCATAKTGPGRNLTSGEILAQLLEMRKEESTQFDRFKVVFMGMGEPLANYDSTVRAIRIMITEEGLSVSPRRVTVSTCGITPGILRLSGEGLRVGLAISLNATTDSKREKLMPVAKKYPLQGLLSAARTYAGGTRRRVTLEYVLIGGVNDSIADATRLASLANGIPCKINVILYNRTSYTSFEPPEEPQTERFLKVLLTSKRAVTFRRSKGVDIDAACGQLGACIKKNVPEAGVSSRRNSPN